MTAMTTSTKLTKDERIEIERAKLTLQFNGLDERHRKIAEKAIDNAAFMSVTLEDLMVKINKKGVTEKYQNGANQFGIKKSTEVEVYNQTLANYLKTIKQLTDMMPETARVSAEDKDLAEITAFVQK